MADPNEEYGNLLNDAQRYLRQQQELYGDLLPREKESVTPTPEGNKSTSAAVEGDLFAVTNPVVRAKVPSYAPPGSNEPWASEATLDGLNNAICTCLKCGLGHTRKKFVFGVGNPRAEVVLIGEAPGADEDEQGEPFVGRAGQLLNKILESVNFKREEVYICNILKCRPPDNRRPQPEEIDLCEPYLWKQLEILKPKMILCLGLTAGQSLLKTTSSLTMLRGKFHDYRGIKLMVTYHPAALLRNPNWKRPVWEDVQMFRKVYEEMKG